MISAVVLTKNEEKNIVDCLESLAWCDEIIVVDDNSEDRTSEIAQKMGASVFVHSLDKDFSKQRNFALSKAKGEWVLFVDADERAASGLKEEIIHLTTVHDRGKELNGFFIRRRDFMWGKELKHGETGSIKLLRLARKDAGEWEGTVHEKWKIKGRVGELKNPLVHYPHQTIAEFLQEINFYTSLSAKQLYKNGIKVRWFDIILYPKAKFIYNYFIKLGFRDGLPGFIFAILMSFHSFLVRGKLWLLWKSH
ncbi:MAG: glycosyltransferase family 2 protein [Candidatus Levybacteria bacterium]|nr:glycosyltransferase family 2 protein [Candidatus Levybacteria bacterium]